MSDKETDFLDSMKTAAEAIPAVETPEVVKDEVTPVVEAVAPTAPEVPSTPVKEPEVVPIAALMAEREKRQREEKARQELERRLAELTPKKEVPDFYQDPIANVDSRFSATEMKFNAALEELVRDQKPDFDEVAQEVIEFAQYNPQVRDEIFSHPNPALAMYNFGKKLREGKAQQTDPEAYRKQLEAEIRKQVQAEFAEQARKAAEEAAAKAQLKDAIPPDLSNTRSATAETVERKSPVFNQLFDN